MNDELDVTNERDRLREAILRHRDQQRPSARRPQDHDLYAALSPPAQQAGQVARYLYDRERYFDSP